MKRRRAFFKLLVFRPFVPLVYHFPFHFGYYPTLLIGGGSLVHISSLQNGTGTVCYDMFGFTATGVLMAQIQSSTTLVNIQGTVLTNTTWTHLAVIYSSANGFRLFINGQMIGSAVTGVITTNYFLYVTLGNNSPGLNASSSACLASSIVGGAYRGAIDEFRLYNRELDSQELCVLANI